MARIKEFFIKHSYVIIWTICYMVMVWAVLRFLFNFDVFRLHNWVRLTRFHLHGFGGLVFGIFILAALPLYFATTVVVVRTKSAPFTIPLPRWLKPEPAPQKKESDQEPVVPVQMQGREEIVLPAGAPKEMREGFVRARRNAAAHQYSVFNKPTAASDVSDTKPQQKPATETPTVDTQKPVLEPARPVAPKTNSQKSESGTVQDTPNGLPLPESFDLDSGAVKNFDVPVFSDIKFGDEPDDEESKDGAGEKQETPSPSNKKFIKYLRKNGVEAKYQNGLFLSDKFAIAVHDDDDLWIADDIDWFAAGKQKPSPIAALKNAQTQYDVTPVLFLDNANIMDSDKLITAWNADGIQVAQSADELEKILTA